MGISAMSPSIQSAGASTSVLKGAMESTAESVLTLLSGMPEPSAPPSSHRMDIRV